MFSYSIKENRVVFRMYYQQLDTVVGKITIVCNEEALIALWIEGQSLAEKHNLSSYKKQQTPLLKQAEEWLVRYWNKEKPKWSELPLHLEGTAFQLEVWKLLCEIPYGTTTTYKVLAEEIARRMHKKRMSAQAVGGAVGKNPISIIVPCHRVIGVNGSLVGYNGGLSIKEKLLKIEEQ